MTISLGFEHVAIKQKKNICKSRLDVDITSEVFRGIYRPVPLIAANMSTVCNSEFCIKLYELGALGILHRAAENSYIIEEVKKVAEHCDIVCASIGVGEDQFEFAKALVDNGANVIVIDVAHAYADWVIEFGRRVKNELPVKLVIGNTVCSDMIEEIADFADALKAGCASGTACETKNTAGCFEPQWSAVRKFKKRSKELGLPVISDGGIREPSHFTKAIGIGANSVMAGSVFARCPESAAELVHTENGPMKIYSGMASRAVQDKWRGGLKKGTCPEGKTIRLPLGEPVEALIERYAGALRSGITYAGGKDIKSFQENVEFIRLA